jgi:poly[(R)-3-hydroxyalkanoate] polymerase subunit PhaC
MDLIPKPGQVVSAASNVAHKVLYGGLADLRPMPRTLIDEGELREVYHYRPAATAREKGDPVLLVTPLAAPALCFDLRRGCSLVEHFVDAGRPTYLVEYGEVSFRNRGLGMEHWIDDVIPTAIEEVSRHAGGRPVHVVGWSLGGIFSLLSAADRPDLPIGSISVVGSPVDVSLVPLVAPLRPLLNLTEGRVLTPVYQAMGGAPKPLVKWAFQLSSIQKLVTKPLALATHLDDADFLAQVEAVDRFTANMIAYPGRSFGQLYHRFVRSNALSTGRFELGDRTIELSAITAPVLVFAGATDGIAPVEAVKAVVPLLSGSREVRFEIVPGGHLGMLTGRAARGSTWRVLDDWVGEWSTTDAATPAARKAATKKAATKKPVTKKAATKKAATKKAATKKAATKTDVKKSATKKSAVKTSAARPAAGKKAAKQTPETTDAIGVNPNRRYGSAGSRSLAR